jgi:ribosomal protein S27AE
VRYDSGMADNKLTRYSCGHVGRTNEGYANKPKAVGFIRVAEIRDQPLAEKDQTCPDCGR